MNLDNIDEEGFEFSEFDAEEFNQQQTLAQAQCIGCIIRIISIGSKVKVPPAPKVPPRVPPVRPPTVPKVPVPKVTVPKVPVPKVPVPKAPVPKVPTGPKLPINIPKPPKVPKLPGQTKLPTASKNVGRLPKSLPKATDMPKLSKAGIDSTRLDKLEKAMNVMEVADISV